VDVARVAGVAAGVVAAASVADVAVGAVAVAGVARVKAGGVVVRGVRCGGEVFRGVADEADALGRVAF
jgi:hypothetical protein